jgi:hypothetical protein
MNYPSLAELLCEVIERDKSKDLRTQSLLISTKELEDRYLKNLPALKSQTVHILYELMTHEIREKESDSKNRRSPKQSQRFNIHRKSKIYIATQDELKKRTGKLPVVRKQDRKKSYEKPGRFAADLAERYEDDVSREWFDRSKARLNQVTGIQHERFEEPSKKRVKAEWDSLFR